MVYQLSKVLSLVTYMQNALYFLNYNYQSLFFKTMSCRKTGLLLGCSSKNPFPNHGGN